LLFYWDKGFNSRAYSLQGVAACRKLGMPKETITDSSEGDLVRLKYTFRFGDKFDEPKDDWLKCIEATSDELLEAYSKKEDNALSATFGGRNKKRLNRVFGAIGFVYLDYCYPLRGQGVKRKIAAAGKAAASAIMAEPKRKKMKVLTHRPRYIEPAVIPEFGEGASSAAKTKETAPPTQRTEDPTAMPKLPSVELAETKADKGKAEETNIEEIKVPKILSSSTEVIVPKAQKSSAATPKRRRMANVLDVVLETAKILSPAPTRKIAEASKAQPRTETKQAEVEAATIQAETEVGPSVPPETEPVVIEENATEQIAFEKVETLAPEASKERIDYIIRHALGKGISQEEKLEALHYAQKLKYPKGVLVFNGSGEEDFLYCLPDNKEISVCREIGRSIGFPKLEDGLSILSKDELADSLAYNSIKV
jgi:3-methyladenine DNA glycosylase Mpg